jgi:hydrogenase maturation protease
MTSRVRVIGIGSPWGDDALGLEAAGMLRIRLDPNYAEVYALDRPGAMLLSHMKGADDVILVDAVRQDRTPGTLVRVDGQGLASLKSGAVSSHGVGVAEVLGLARSLGVAPKTMVLWGMEPSCFIGEPGCGLSAAAERALPQLVTAVVEEVRRLQPVAVLDI